MNPTDPETTDNANRRRTRADAPATAAQEGAAFETGSAGAASDGAGDAVASAEATGQGQESGALRDPRRRKRNRRRGRRGDRAGAAGTDAVTANEGDGSGDGDEDAVPVDLAPDRLEQAAVLEKTDPAELFGAVVSGAFDVDVPTEEMAPAADQVGGDAAASSVESPPVAGAARQERPRRVLAPEADAPKLHKVLAQSGVGSRRDLEQMIVDGRVTVNAQPAHIGQRISFGDKIAIDGKPVKVRIAPPPPRVIAYHKPAGEVVTHDDPQQRPTVFRRLPRLPQGKWQSVGRLDINTEGLLLFTNSGDLANRLMHPRFGVEREYAVRILGTLSEEGRAKLLEGVEIDGQSAAFKSIEDGGGDGANRWVRVVITEGRNREVRKLFDAVGHAVSRLIRIRYGSVVLPKGLRRGVWVDLPAEDIKALRFMTSGGAQGPGAGGPRPAQGSGPAAGPQARKSNRRGRTRGAGPADFAPGMRGAPDIDSGEPENFGPIPNPLQQTYDKRAIQQARRVRDIDENGPIPNPLQQTYDRRALQAEARPKRELDEDGPIPNPLQQTYDKRFAKPAKAHAGAGGGGGGGGGGAGGGRARKKPVGGKSQAAGGQPDPMRTSVGYIGADAFHQKGKSGRSGKGGRRR
jgi:23S rRNA pseudouridine2605 synthase